MVDSVKEYPLTRNVMIDGERYILKFTIYNFQVRNGSGVVDMEIEKMSDRQGAIDKNKTNMLE